MRQGSASGRYRGKWTRFRFHSEGILNHRLERMYGPKTERIALSGRSATMQPEMKVPIGVAEAEAMAAWLESAASKLKLIADDDETYVDSFCLQYKQAAAEAREWARVVKPVPIKRRG